MAGITIPQMISNTAAAAGVPPALALAVAQQESSFNPSAVSPKGAVGLFQLMPATAASLGVTDSTDPVQNAQGGISYLAQLYSQFGNWVDALTAYNWGPTNVSNYGSSAAPASTQQYVSTILANSGLLPTQAPVSPTAAADGSAAAVPELTDIYADSTPLLPDTTSATNGGVNWVLLAIIAAAVYLGAQFLFAE
jgi:hypothetical protein